jgi:hypothetical protein
MKHDEVEVIGDLTQNSADHRQFVARLAGDAA